jgi:hypothetical protein
MTDPLLLVLRAPRDDAPREAFAASVADVDPDRAEFIRTQLDIARSRRAGRPYDAAASARAMALAARHGRRWAADVSPLAGRFQFRRGFVEEVHLSPAVFVERADALFRAAPVLDLVATSADGLADLLDSPFAARLRSLSLFDLRLGDELASMLADSPFLTGLAWLDLRHNRLTDRAIDRLAGAKNLPSLRFCALSDNAGEDPNPRGDDDEGGRRGLKRTWAGVRVEKQFGKLPWLGRFTSDDGPDPEAVG